MEERDSLKIGDKTYRIEVTWAVLMGYLQRAGIKMEDEDSPMIDPDALVWAIWAAARVGARREGQKFTLTLKDVEDAENGFEMAEKFIPILNRQTAAQTPVEDAKKK